MKMRRFNEHGVAAFREYVLAARAQAKAKQAVPPVPLEILSEAALTEVLEYELPSDEPEFATKLDIGVFVTGVIPVEHYERVRGDEGLWTWMAARYFDRLTQGRKKIKEPRAYLAALNFQDFYRHLILGPYIVYSMAQDEPERVRVLLYDEPTTMNEVMVQFGSYQTLLQNPELQRVVQRLYYDPEKKRIRRGAGGKVNGAPRRLMDFFRQIELNYDLRSIEAERFWGMLPKEFDRFKASAEAM